MKALKGFDTWAELLDHIAADYTLWYQAPMDVRPTEVVPRLVKGKLRILPPFWSQADAFWADEQHLDRFRREADHRHREVR